VLLVTAVIDAGGCDDGGADSDECDVAVVGDDDGLVEGVCGVVCSETVVVFVVKVFWVSTESV